MSNFLAFTFTQTLETDWANACAVWQQREGVGSGEEGPKWQMSPEHALCLDFARLYPDATSRPFFIRQLTHPDARIAAYAFKVLIRLDVEPPEMPMAVFARRETIRVQVHSDIREHHLGDWFLDYFGLEAEEAEHPDTAGDGERLIHRQDRQTLEWQEGPLATYLKASSLVAEPADIPEEDASGQGGKEQPPGPPQSSK
ncbi:MAG TPA: hypothetical protein VGE29_17995 [Prosthecobacter sp.]